MQKTVIAEFTYRDPKTNKEFAVQRSWPCKDQQDAERIVKYYGMKTGAFNAKCFIEEASNEEIKSSKTETTTKETHQA
jgi:hypothetical protein